MHSKTGLGVFFGGTLSWKHPILGISPISKQTNVCDSRSNACVCFVRGPQNAVFYLVSFASHKTRVPLKRHTQFDSWEAMGISTGWPIPTPNVGGVGTVPVSPLPLIAGFDASTPKRASARFWGRGDVLNNSVFVWVAWLVLFKGNFGVVPRNPLVSCKAN